MAFERRLLVLFLIGLWLGLLSVTQNIGGHILGRIGSTVKSGRLRVLLYFEI